MSEVEAGTAARLGWRSVLVGVTTFAIVGLWVSGLVLFFTPEDLYARVDRELARDEASARLYALMKSDFPEEYGEFRDEMVAEYEAGAVDEEMGQFAHNYMRNLVATSLGDIARAPDAELGAVFAASQEVTQKLSIQSDYWCAAFGAGGLPPGAGLDDPESKAAIEAMGMANMRAIAAGRRDPTERGELEQSELQALFDALVDNGLSQWEANAVLTGTSMVHLPAVRQCDIGLALHRAVQDLPHDTSMRVMSTMFSVRS